MYLAYNTILTAVIILLSPLLCIILLFRKKYRSGFFEKCGLPARRAPLPSRPVWIHAVSVGEVMAAAPLIREIKKRYAGVPVLLSTVTETGNLTARRNLKIVDEVMYFPFDYPAVVRRVIAQYNPRIFVTLETEIWPNFLRELKRRGIPSMIVSGRISGKSFKSYHFFRFFFRRVLSGIDCFCMQTEKDCERIIRIGAPAGKVVIAGNIKFDQQMPPITDQEQEEIYKALKIKNGQHVFIAGSTHRGEEEIIIDVFSQIQNRFPGAVLVIAPRHPERFAEVETLLKQKGLSWIRKTALENSAGEGAYAIILLDTIGELSKIYSLGTIVFIGGSLVPVGGHNVLEPAVFRKPVIFGRHMANFAEIAKILQRKNAAVQVAGSDELARQALALLADADLRRQIGETAFSVIKDNSGAVKKSVDLLNSLLKQ